MRLEVGKYYMDAKGNKRWPMREGHGLFDYPKSKGTFYVSGSSYAGHDPSLITEWTDEPVTGTLKELNVKPGDVVECVDNKCMYGWTKGKQYTVFRVQGALYCNGVTKGIYDGSCTAKFSIISRASQSTTPVAHPTTPHSPIRTVTRKEILPGVYGRVTVERLDNSDWCFEVKSMRTADELTKAIETLTEIRDVLENP